MDNENEVKNAKRYFHHFCVETKSMVYTNTSYTYRLRMERYFNESVTEESIGRAALEEGYTVHTIRKGDSETNYFNVRLNKEHEVCSCKKCGHVWKSVSAYPRMVCGQLVSRPLRCARCHSKKWHE